jgi:hypothetical protein
VINSTRFWFLPFRLILVSFTEKTTVSLPAELDESALSACTVQGGEGWG